VYPVMKRLIGGTAVLLILTGLAYAYWTWKTASLSADGPRLDNLHISPPSRCQTVTISCDSGPPTYTAHGDVVVPNEPEMCFPRGDLFFSVRVSPRQYLQFSRCPTIAYEINRKGNVSRVQTLITSGSHDIDSIAVNAVKARRFTMPQHCFSCRMETRVDVDFELHN